MKKGYLQLYTGNGKGKTTAALGLALRAAGAEMKTWIGQFAKGPGYSEHTALKRYDEMITIKQFGNQGFIRGKPSPEDTSNAIKGLGEAEKVLADGEYQLVILDEVCIALHFNMFTVDRLLQVINCRADHVEVIMTGRNAPAELIDAMDLVTEMKEIKHYYAQGVQARIGIEK